MRRKGSSTERLAALFLLAVVLLMPPFLGIFNVPRLVAGVPLLYLYLFAVWLCLIVAVALVVEQMDEPAGAPETGGEAGNEAGFEPHAERRER
jgi:Ca2+/Na+ antiporter